VHLPVESVTTVELPSDEVLVEKLPEPPDVIVPPGPVVVPVTLPLPAVIDVDMELLPDGGDSPFFSSTTLQLSVDVDEVPEPVPARAVDVLLDELPDDELLELVCAIAVDMPTADTARNATNAFTGDLL
jgi:hypothetical protein